MREVAPFLRVAGDSFQLTAGSPGDLRFLHYADRIFAFICPYRFETFRLGPSQMSHQTVRFITRMYPNLEKLDGCHDSRKPWVLDVADNSFIAAAAEHLVPEIKHHLANCLITAPNFRFSGAGKLRLLFRNALTPRASLDSALATLTLIRDYTQTGPMLTVRVATVLQDLCKHAFEPQPVLPHIMTPIPTPLASLSPTPTSMSATYAETVTRSAPDPVVTATTRAASDPVVTVAADKPMLTPVTAAPTHPVKAHNTPDLVFRFDELRKLHGVRVATLQSPTLLFSSINNKDTIGDLKLASIRWTPRGNLTLAFTHDEQFKNAHIIPWTSIITDRAQGHSEPLSDINGLMVTVALAGYLQGNCPQGQCSLDVIRSLVRGEIERQGKYKGNHRVVAFGAALKPNPCVYDWIVPFIPRIIERLAHKFSSGENVRVEVPLPKRALDNSGQSLVRWADAITAGSDIYEFKLVNASAEAPNTGNHVRLSIGNENR
ncbi:hypothetical protein K438DRAFT_1972234 [Mycena galopus ATCC 62051]|nr:hypothetical protein K438DRAFT_1972234 [Mycena galopus ATCC 62051]